MSMLLLLLSVLGIGFVSYPGDDQDEKDSGHKEIRPDDEQPFLDDEDNEVGRVESKNDIFINDRPKVDSNTNYDLGLNILYGREPYEQSLEFGVSTEQSCKIAAWHIQKSSRTEAKIELGHMRLLGIGTSQSIDKARTLWTKASAQGSIEAELTLKAFNAFLENMKYVPPAEQKLAIPLPDCTDQNYKQYLKEAKAGDANSSYLLANYYFDNDKNKDGLKWLKLAAEAEHPKACGHLAYCYYRKTGADPVIFHSELEIKTHFEERMKVVLFWFNKSEDLFKKLIASGDAEASFSLYELYHTFLHISVIPNNEEKYINWIRDSAWLGDSWAQYLLGSYYLDIVYEDSDEYYDNPAGRLENILESKPLKKRDFDACGNEFMVWMEAIKWLRLATYQGHFEARILLAKLLAARDCDSKNSYWTEYLIQKWLRLPSTNITLEQHAVLGDSYSGTFRGSKYGSSYDDWRSDAGVRGERISNPIIKRPKQAVEHYRIAAKGGNIYGMYALAKCAEAGTGTKQSIKTAFKWYKKAALSGHHHSQYRLYLMYKDGEGIKQNDREAVQWFLKAAESGNARAMFAAGLAYYEGKILEQNYKEAIKWFERSAKKWSFNASYHYLGMCYFKGWGAKRDFKKALSYFEISQSSESYYYTGLIYQEGLGTSPDPEKAVSAFKRAVAKGNKEAADRLPGPGLDTGK